MRIHPCSSSSRVTEQSLGRETLEEIWKGFQTNCGGTKHAYRIHFFGLVTLAHGILVDSFTALIQSFTAILDEFGVSLNHAKHASLCAGEGLILAWISPPSSHCVVHSRSYRRVQRDYRRCKIPHKPILKPRIAETNKLKQAQDKLSLLTLKTLKLKKEIVEAQPEIHHYVNQFSILQESFDSQALSLKLAKEHAGDLQDQLLKSQKTSATQSERAISESRRDVAVLEEQKASLERNTIIVKLEESCSAAAASRVELLEQIATSEASFKSQIVGLQATFTTQITSGDKRAKEQKYVYDAATKTLQDQKASLDRTIKSLQNESKAHLAEMTNLKVEKVEMARQQESFDHRLKAESASAADAKKAFVELQQLAKEAEVLLAHATEESRGLEDKARLAAEAADSAKTELITTSAKLHAMEGELSDLRQREGTLASRYQAGKLNDAEKTFVQSLLQMTREMYEQDVVNKENELRSKDSMLASMQSKIASLESALAKCLKKQAGSDSARQTKPIVDLNFWMSSRTTKLDR